MEGDNAVLDPHLVRRYQAALSQGPGSPQSELALTGILINGKPISTLLAKDLKDMIKASYPGIHLSSIKAKLAHHVATKVLEQPPGNVTLDSWIFPAPDPNVEGGMAEEQPEEHIGPPEEVLDEPLGGEDMLNAAGGDEEADDVGEEEGDEPLRDVLEMTCVQLRKELRAANEVVFGVKKVLQDRLLAYRARAAGSAHGTHQPVDNEVEEGSDVPDIDVEEHPHDDNASEDGSGANSEEVGSPQAHVHVEEGSPVDSEESEGTPPPPPPAPPRGPSLGGRFVSMIGAGLRRMSGAFSSKAASEAEEGEGSGEDEEGAGMADAGDTPDTHVSSEGEEGAHVEVGRTEAGKFTVGGKAVDKMSKLELQDALEKFGEGTTGLKQELYHRLLRVLEAQMAGSEEPSFEEEQEGEGAPAAVETHAETEDTSHDYGHAHSTVDEEEEGSAAVVAQEDVAADSGHALSPDEVEASVSVPAQGAPAVSANAYDLRTQVLRSHVQDGGDSMHVSASEPGHVVETGVNVEVGGAPADDQHEHDYLQEPDHDQQEVGDVAVEDTHAQPQVQVAEDLEPQADMEVEDMDAGTSSSMHAGEEQEADAHDDLVGDERDEQPHEHVMGEEGHEAEYVMTIGQGGHGGTLMINGRKASALEESEIRAALASINEETDGDKKVLLDRLKAAVRKAIPSTYRGVSPLPPKKGNRGKNSSPAALKGREERERSTSMHSQETHEAEDSEEEDAPVAESETQHDKHDAPAEEEKHDIVVKVGARNVVTINGKPAHKLNKPVIQEALLACGEQDTSGKKVELIDRLRSSVKKSKKARADIPGPAASSAQSMRLEQESGTLPVIEEGRMLAGALMKEAEGGSSMPKKGNSPPPSFDRATGGTRHAARAAQFASPPPSRMPPVRKAAKAAAENFPRKEPKSASKVPAPSDAPAIRRPIGRPRKSAAKGSPSAAEEDEDETDIVPPASHVLYLGTPLTEMKLEALKDLCHLFQIVDYGKKSVVSERLCPVLLEACAEAKEGRWRGEPIKSLKQPTLLQLVNTLDLNSCVGKRLTGQAVALAMQTWATDGIKIATEPQETGAQEPPAASAAQPQVGAEDDDDVSDEDDVSDVEEGDSPVQQEEMVVQAGGRHRPAPVNFMAPAVPRHQRSDIALSGETGADADSEASDGEGTEAEEEVARVPPPVIPVLIQQAAAVPPVPAAPGPARPKGGKMKARPRHVHHAESVVPSRAHIPSPHGTDADEEGDGEGNQKAVPVAPARLDRGRSRTRERPELRGAVLVGGSGVARPDRIGAEPSIVAAEQVRSSEGAPHGRAASVSEREKAGGRGGNGDTETEGDGDAPAKDQNLPAGGGGSGMGGKKSSSHDSSSDDDDERKRKKTRAAHDTERKTAESTESEETEDDVGSDPALQSPTRPSQEAAAVRGQVDEEGGSEFLHAEVPHGAESEGDGDREEPEQHAVPEDVRAPGSPEADDAPDALAGSPDEAQPEHVREEEPEPEPRINGPGWGEFKGGMDSEDYARALPDGVHMAVDEGAEAAAAENLEGMELESLHGILDPDVGRREESEEEQEVGMIDPAAAVDLELAPPVGVGHLIEPAGHDDEYARDEEQSSGSDGEQEEQKQYSASESGGLQSDYGSVVGDGDLDAPSDDGSGPAEQGPIVGNGSESDSGSGSPSEGDVQPSSEEEGGDQGGSQVVIDLLEDSDENGGNGGSDAENTEEEEEGLSEGGQQQQPGARDEQLSSSSSEEAEEQEAAGDAEAPFTSPISPISRERREPSESPHAERSPSPPRAASPVASPIQPAVGSVRPRSPSPSHTMSPLPAKRQHIAPPSAEEEFMDAEDGYTETDRMASSPSASGRPAASPVRQPSPALHAVASPVQPLAVERSSPSPAKASKRKRETSAPSPLKPHEAARADDSAKKYSSTVRHHLTKEQRDLFIQLGEIQRAGGRLDELVTREQALFLRRQMCHKKRIFAGCPVVPVEWDPRPAGPSCVPVLVNPASTYEWIKKIARVHCGVYYRNLPPGSDRLDMSPLLGLASAFGPPPPRDDEPREMGGRGSVFTMVSPRSRSRSRSRSPKRRNVYDDDRDSSFSRMPPPPARHQGRNSQYSDDSYNGHNRQSSSSAILYAGPTPLRSAPDRSHTPRTMNGGPRTGNRGLRALERTPRPAGSLMMNGTPINDEIRLSARKQLSQTLTNAIQGTSAPQGTPNNARESNSWGRSMRPGGVLGTPSTALPPPSTQTFGGSNSLSMPAIAPPASTSSSAFQGFDMSKFGVKPGHWKCPSCAVQNANSCNKCPCCETDKPGGASSGAASASTSTPAAAGASGTFAFNGTSPAPLTSATATSAPATMGFDMSKFGVKPGHWKCPSCAVQNADSYSKCPCCETDKPGSSSKDSTGGADKPAVAGSIGASGFSFGAPTAAGGTQFTFGGASTSAAVGGAATNKFNFGAFPAAGTGGGASASTSFNFGALAPSVPTSEAVGSKRPAASITADAVPEAGARASGRRPKKAKTDKGYTFSDPVPDETSGGALSPVLEGMHNPAQFVFSPSVKRASKRVTRSARSNASSMPVPSAAGFQFGAGFGPNK